jgi:DNA-directed RNA polymerase specialized sigma24 family protein
MDDLKLDCFDGFTIRFIRSKVYKLTGKRGFTKSDYPDLIQNFACDLIQRSKHFDPTTANWEAFVVVVCENCFATILEHRRAERRSHAREAGSLNRLVKDTEGDQVEVGSTIPDSQHARRTFQHRRAHEDACDLALDTTDMLKMLLPPLRDLCKQLKRVAVSEIARETGVSRPELYRRISRIRRCFERSGMRDYL